jgi:uncharacterized protein YutE (UPF0331/DUF86 family)
MTEVIAQKVTSLQRCIARAREALAAAGTQFPTDYNLQDAAILNVIRACDTTIDLANMLIRRRHFGIPSESKDSFVILMRENVIAAELADRLKKMVGFRNLAVHQYRELDVDIVEAVIRKNLDDLLEFAQVIRAQLDGKPNADQGAR